MAPFTPRAVVEDYYRAMGEGDFDHVVSLHAPNLVCWMSGRSLVSGRFQGRTELYAHMGAHVLGPLMFGAEPYVKGSRIAIVDGDIAVGLLHGGLPAHDGGRYDQFYLQIFRFENGLIGEIVELFDTVMVETQLMKNQLTLPRVPPVAAFDLDAPAVSSGMTREGMVEIARLFSTSIAIGDFDSAARLLTESAEMRIIGSTPVSGRTRNPAVLAALFAHGLADVRMVAADTNAAVLLAHAGDTGYAQQYGLLVEADGSKIGCVSIFFDTVEAEAQQFGNPLLPGASTSIMPDFDIRLPFSARKD